MIDHKCDGSLSAGVSIRRYSGYMFGRDNGWHMILWAADMIDVGWAGYDCGPVSYCPYCGEYNRLKKKKEKPIE